MKNILIVCSYFDGQSTGSLRMRALHKSLLNEGHEVHVFTQFFAEHHKLKNIYAPQDIATAIECYSLSLGTVYRAYRKLMYYCFGIRCHSFYRKFICFDGNKLNGKSLDAVIVSVPQPEFVDVAISVSDLFGCPLFVDFRDGLTFEPLGHNNWVSSYFNLKLERRAVLKSSAVVSVSDALTDDFESRYLDASDFYTITNGFNLGSLKKSSAQVASASIFGTNDGRVNILYSGAIERSRLSIFQSLETFEAALHMLDYEARKRLNIVFVGNYSDREALKIKKIGSVMNPVSRTAIFDAQCQADYLLLFTGPDQSVVTMKLFDYLVARKPIISIGNAPTPKRILFDTGAGHQYCLAAKKEIADVLSKLQPVQSSLNTDLDEYNLDSLMGRFAKLVLERMKND
tara:strand:- start:36 stop:1235 length:1200 start_codon:yes stop_codon:yes gene_type:complete